MRHGTSRYAALREIAVSMGAALPGTFEVTGERIVHDRRRPARPHELTVLRVRRRLEQILPEGLVAYTGTPDVEHVGEGVMRHPDVMVIAEADMEGEGSFDPHTVLAAIEVVSRSDPDNDWVGKMRDYPLLGIPVYAVFDPRTGSGAVLGNIHTTPSGPRYATRREFVYGEKVTLGDWTIPTEGLPLYAD